MCDLPGIVPGLHYADSASAFPLLIMLIPLEHCQEAVATFLKRL